eukprot:TRINITY_DN19528_c0_g1_i1.p1 TRINITY_DN19528_c0_g1~~TRINITY_DN19528_c0_g1_i1.p1  ORF type:complete len:395 (+),score=89.32 TRINITY_DN19528_c0_g1_i1:174-1358(+)
MVRPRFTPAAVSDILLAAVMATDSTDGAVYEFNESDGCLIKSTEVGRMPKGGEALAESVQQSEMSVSYSCLLPDQVNERATQYGTNGGKRMLSKSNSCISIAIPDKRGTLQVQKECNYTEEQLSLLAVTSILLSFCCRRGGESRPSKKRPKNIRVIQRVDKDIQPDGVDLSRPCQLLADARRYHDSLVSLLSMKTTKLNKTVSENRQSELKLEAQLKENYKNMEEINVLRKQLVASEAKQHQLMNEINELRKQQTTTKMDTNSLIGSTSQSSTATAAADDIYDFGQTGGDGSLAFDYFNATTKTEGHSVSSIISYLSSQKEPKPCRHILLSPHYADKKLKREAEVTATRSHVALTPSAPVIVRSVDLKNNTQSSIPGIRRTFTNKRRVVKVDRL